MGERTCIVTGQNLPRDQLIRIVANPDGFAVADLAEKLPGRGVWVSNDAGAVRRADSNGLFKRSIDASFRDIENDISMIAVLMRKRALSLAAMARRSGALIGGGGKLTSEGQFVGLLAAPDASQRELRKLSTRIEARWVSQILDATELGQICGRPSLAFAAIRGGKSAKLAENLKHELGRLEAFYVSSGCHAG